MKYNSVIVKLFNADGGIDPFEPHSFIAEVEEEHYFFKIRDNDLYVYYNTIEDINKRAKIVKVYAFGRWAEAEYV